MSRRKHLVCKQTSERLYWRSNVSWQTSVSKQTRRAGQDAFSPHMHVRLYKCLHFSMCACHLCAGAMLIFSASLQFQRVIPEGNPSGLRYVEVERSHGSAIRDPPLPEGNPDAFGPHVHCAGRRTPPLRDRRLDFVEEA